MDLEALGFKALDALHIAYGPLDVGRQLFNPQAKSEERRGRWRN